MSPSPRPKADREIESIKAILGALEGLEGESIQRVLDYVFGRLSLSRPSRASLTPSAGPVPVSYGEASQRAKQLSIRDLKDEKQPDSSNQMAALVAYYLSELVPSHERKETISSADIEKFFKQAAFKLPKAIQSTLPNATAAGYFDSIGGGQYRLNAVGYNLVVHGLPRAANANPAGRSKKKGAKKKARR